ncbi:MAG: CoF synthetase [Candidatus Melainabacteria bacterium]|nr:CoF synthetase [Candidatus Melainabacteria bacterium]
MKVRKHLIFAFVIAAAFVRLLLEKSGLGFKLLFLPGTSPLRDQIGKWKAWYAFEKARRECPAYEAFCAKHNCEVTLDGWTPNFSQVVAMDKPNYIKAYDIASRCHGGKLPTRGAVIDQSSGSTGKPTNWVRGSAERKAVARTIQLALREFAGRKKKILFVNAFALGPWATGMCVSYSVCDETLLISTGPDIDKIIGTLEDFGSEGWLYVIAGYPPFLKMLADSKKLDWKKYQALGFYGGEGMSEGMRTYLMGTFREVYGDYGASDLEINIAAENAFTVAVRRLMEQNPALRRRINSAVSKHNGLNRLEDALPHIFQYNQLDYLVESNDEGELIITLTRSSNVSPRIKYNIHDNGHVMTYGELCQMLDQEGVSVRTLPPAIANLPLMFHYGRSDLAASWWGCKIPPTDMEKICFEIAELSTIFNSFRLITRENAEHNKLLEIAIELGDGQPIPANAAELEAQVFQLLEHHNQDFRESARIAAQKGIIPKVVFYGFRQGPFVGSDIRLKNKYTEETSVK